jgi:hypothetical protein
MPEMTAADRTFVFGHARDYARPDLDQDRADAYARWYMERYAGPGVAMDELPSHDHAYHRFMNEYTA